MGKADPPCRLGLPILRLSGRCGESLPDRAFSPRFAIWPQADSQDTAKLFGAIENDQTVLPAIGKTRKSLEIVAGTMFGADAAHALKACGNAGNYAAVSSHQCSFAQALGLICISSVSKSSVAVRSPLLGLLRSRVQADCFSRRWTPSRSSPRGLPAIPRPHRCRPYSRRCRWRRDRRRSANHSCPHISPSHPAECQSRTSSSADPSS